MTPFNTRGIILVPGKWYLVRISLMRNFRVFTEGGLMKSRSENELPFHCIC